MLSPGDVTDCTDVEILEEVQSSLPEGWVCDYRMVDGWFKFSLFEGEKLRWEETNPDPRYLLLNAFGWLLSRGYKSTHPAWSPRTHEVDPNKTRIHPRTAKQPTISVPDPEDLDPNEIASVYRDRGTK